MFLKRLIYTSVFTLYSIIFFYMAYYLITNYFPEFTWLPDAIELSHFMKLLGIFTLIVILSFWGANLVVYGSNSGADKSD